VGGGLTLDVTEKYATEAMNIFAQPVRGGAQQNDARRESKTTKAKGASALPGETALEFKFPESPVRFRTQSPAEFF
jgi:hypothetical protein